MRECLEDGVNVELSKIERELMRLETNLKKARIGRGFTSYEFNDGLLGIRDKLGFIQLLSKDHGIQLSSDTIRKVKKIDDRLSMLLPEVMSLFRSQNDDPTPIKEAFPREFWWRTV